MQRSALFRSRRELSNEYLLAKIGVDTAENEPLEVWAKIQFTIHFTPYVRPFWLLPALTQSASSPVDTSTRSTRTFDEHSTSTPSVFGLCSGFRIFTSRTWGICTRRAGKLCSARSLLYRRLRLREWAHFLAFFAIYKIFTPSHRSGLKISAKNCHIFFLFRQKNLKNLQNFGQNLANFHEISPEFHVNFEVLKGRGLPGFFPGSSRRSSVFFQADALHSAAF